MSRGSFNHSRISAAVPHLQGRSQPGRDVSHGCRLPHAGARPQHGWEFHILSPSAALQSKPGPLTDQTQTNPFFHCRATTLRKLIYAEEDFGFTTRTQCCGRPADKTFCLGIKVLHQALALLLSWLCHEQEGFDRWFCCEKGGTLILATSHESHFASLKKMFLDTRPKPVGDGGVGMKKQLGIATHPMACVFAGQGTQLHSMSLSAHLQHLSWVIPTTTAEEG